MSLKDKLLNPNQTSLLGLAGNPGPEFENQGQMNTSEIHAFLGNPQTNTLQKSQDLVSGRLSRQIPFNTYFKAASQPPVSFENGFEGKVAPHGPYQSKGPADGRY